MFLPPCRAVHQGMRTLHRLSAAAVLLRRSLFASRVPAVVSQGHHTAKTAGFETRPIPHAGLRTKEENMRELVRLAEVREAQAKQELVHLLQSRSNMFEAQNAAGEGQPDYATHDREIDDARRRMASAKEKFNKLRTVCISAQQVGVAASCMYSCV